MCSRKRKILFIFVSVAGTSILGTRGTVDPDPLSWALSKQHNLSAESEGPGQETGARSPAAIRRAANWESGDLGAAPGCAIINKLCDLGGGRWFLWIWEVDCDLEDPCKSEPMMLRSKYGSVQGVARVADPWHIRSEKHWASRGALPA